MILDFNNSKVKSLKALLGFYQKACSSGCVHDDMQNSKLNCDSCRYTKDINNITLKIEKTEGRC